MRRWLWFNGLSLVAFGAFLAFLVRQSVFGWQVRKFRATRIRWAHRQLLALSRHTSLRGGCVRELGVRVPPDGFVRTAPGVPATTGVRAGAGTVIRFGIFFVVEVSRAFVGGRPPLGRRIGYRAASVRNALRNSSGRSMCGEWPQPSSTTSVNEPPAAA